MTAARSPMRIHGACHCGAIAYEASVDPARVTVCHCTDCQSLSGSAYRVSVPVAADDLRLTRGTPTLYVKVADSGNRRVQAFCARCGSPLYTHADEPRPTSYGLRVGAIRERAALVPRKRIWCRWALPWSADLGGLPQHDRE